MDYFSIAAILTVLSAVFGYINVRFLKLPITIGLMIISDILGWCGSNQLTVQDLRK